MTAKTALAFTATSVFVGLSFLYMMSAAGIKRPWWGLIAAIAMATYLLELWP